FVLLLSQASGISQLGWRDRRDLTGGRPRGSHSIGRTDQRLGFRQLTRQRLLSIRSACLAIGVLPKLGVKPIQRGKIRIHLLRKLSQVPALETTYALLLLIQSGLRLIELDLQKFCGSGRLAFTRLRVLLVVEGRESVRDARHRLRVTSLVGDCERDGGLTQTAQLGTLDLKLDVAAHPADDILKRNALAKFAVQAESIDQLLQAGPAQDLLADCVQTSFERARDGRPHERLGNLLAID